LLSAPVAAPAAPAPGLPFGGVPAQPSYPAPQPVAPAAPRPTQQPVAPAAPRPVVPVQQPPPQRLVLAPASLIVRSSGARLPLPAAAEATMGRADPVSNFFPEVDLTDHEAIASGVGRRHARLFIQSGQVLVEDLDSTNGTFRNGARLAPRQPVALANGDELRLGNLALTVQL
jgi:pSer/pThr/pTyr-binding forkhead associated (FHA) protein